MKIRQVAKTNGGQDGTLWGGYMFRFDNVGHCRVYDAEKLETKNGKISELEEICEFSLDKMDIISPHSNAVMFGSEYYAAGDEFPILYSNIYNNYAKSEDKMKGVCLAYRLQRNGLEFSTTLVQIIEIGFVNDCSLWKSSEAEEDIRPYGNFTIDRENRIYYAFVMRDKSKTTRYFAFDLPKISDGEQDAAYGVKRVVLNSGDIKKYFDCPYHNFIQGACFNDGKIYSVEGFTNSSDNPPALRVIDTKEEKQILFVDLVKEGLEVEPEMIEFYEDTCYYSDGHGNIFELEF